MAFTHEQKVAALSGILSDGDVRDVIREELDDDILQALDEFNTDLTTPQKATAGPSGDGIDANLLKEMGKAYRQKYDAAEASGDNDNKLRYHGAMVAIGGILSLISK